MALQNQQMPPPFSTEKRKRMQKVHPLLRALAAIGADKAHTIIPFLSNKSISFLCQSIYNLLYRFKPFVGDEVRQQMRAMNETDKKKIRYLSKKHADLKRKRNILQKGGNPLMLITSFILPFIDFVLSHSSSS